MKKFLILIAAVILFNSVANAQPRAIGLRIYDGVEASYQHTFGPGFAELSAGGGRGLFLITGTYDFKIFSNDIFTFYAGPGANVACHQNSAYFSIVGQIGFEYAIPAIPLNISIDWRPMYMFVPGNNSFIGSAVAGGLRYRF